MIVWFAFAFLGGLMLSYMLFGIDVLTFKLFA